MAAGRSEGAPLPDRAVLVVEVTSPSNGDTGRTAKRRRYSQFGPPVHLLVDRRESTCALFFRPGRLGCTRVEGPHPLGTPLRLPAPLGLVLDTTGF
ncbi:Uma2 family endonuclease [Kitasatospora sp. NPDC059327]|uniref:Uma2 family endonuclease n=1 Tax=Kitasatospora sp. NPDC059327 TaxID=3346803 RepID=UPI00369FC05E